MEYTESLCAKGCGFFGTPEQWGMCSRCYDDFLRENLIAKGSERTSDSPATVASVDDLTARTDKLSTSEETRASQDLQGDEASECNEPQKPVRNRCKTCSKRLGLLGFQCRCGDLFCGTHRYPEEHACKVDFKTSARKVLAKQNPQCVADRMEYRV